MKKKDIIFIVIVVLALLYFAPWFIACKSANFISNTHPEYYSTPEAFAQAYPVLNAVTWLLRIDMFGVLATNWNILEHLIEVMRYCFWHMVFSVTIVCGCLVMLLHRTYSKRKHKIIARTIQIFITLCMFACIMSVIASVVTHKRTAYHWDRKRDPNVLQNHYHFEKMNTDILTPYCKQGVLLTKSECYDYHIEMDRRGKMSRNGFHLTRDEMTEEVSSNTKPIRFLLWFDWRCTSDMRNEVYSIATNANPKEVYFVVQEYKNQDTFATYKGIKPHDMFRMIESGEVAVSTRINSPYKPPPDKEDDDSEDIEVKISIPTSKPSEKAEE